MNISSTNRPCPTTAPKQNWANTRKKNPDGTMGSSPTEELRDYVSLSAAATAVGATAAYAGAQLAGGDFNALPMLLTIGGATILGTGAGSAMQVGLGKVMGTGMPRQNEKLRVGLGGMISIGLAACGGVMAGAAGLSPLSVACVAAGAVPALTMLMDAGMTS